MGVVILVELLVGMIECPERRFRRHFGDNLLAEDSYISESCSTVNIAAICKTCLTVTRRHIEDRRLEIIYSNLLHNYSTDPIELIELPVNTDASFIYSSVIDLSLTGRSTLISTSQKR